MAARHEGEAFQKENPFGRPSIQTIIRYQTTINRQLFQAMNQLGRLQRLRKGENVPAPLKLEVFGDPPTMSERERAPIDESDPRRITRSNWHGPMMNNVG